MGTPVDFRGSNFVFAAPKGEENRVGNLPVFKNGHCIVSCWELAEQELEDINLRRQVFLSNWSGDVLFPQFLGSERTVRSVVVDFGKIW